MDVEAKRRRLAATFDGVAALYDEVRPRYPEALVDFVVARAGIPDGGAILEIGAGPGNATLSFAARGYAMTCLEPGPALAARLRAHVRPYPRVRVESTRFEDWPLDTGAFHLVIAAQSLHWIRPEVVYDKTADALCSAGWLAAFWNRPAEQESSAVARAVAEAYRAHAPSLVGGASLGGRDWRAEMLASGRFDEVVTGTFPWRTRYTTEAFGKLLRTHSDHQALPPHDLDRLHDAVCGAVDRHGGSIEVARVARLTMARRRPTA